MFAGIDLHPEAVSNTEMGTVFEELIRKFAEDSNGTGGALYPPRGHLAHGQSARHRGRRGAGQARRRAHHLRPDCRHRWRRSQLAAYIARTQPGLRGFTCPNLFRMKHFCEAYRDQPIVSAVPRQLPWTHHLIILGQSKLPQEREFHLCMAVEERWSSRQLERQFKAALFERAVLTPPRCRRR